MNKKKTLNEINKNLKPRKIIKAILIILSCSYIIILTFDNMNLLKNPLIRESYTSYLKNEVEKSLINLKGVDLWVKKDNIDIFADKTDNENLEARQNNIDFITKPDNIVKSLLKGKLISSYFSYGADIYDSIIHYKVPYKVRLVDDIIPIRHENYWGDVWYTYKEKYHTETWVSHRTKIKPIKYDYYYSLSVYDLSNKYSFFKNEKKLTENLFENIYRHMTAPKWYFYPNFCWKNKNDSTKAMSHITYNKNGEKLLQSVFIANKKAYLLEVCANYELKERANYILSNLTTNSPKETRNSIQNKLYQKNAIFFICILIYLSAMFLRKRHINNKISYKLLCYTSITTLITFCLIVNEWHLIYTNYLIYDNYFKLIIFTLILNLLIINFTFIAYLHKKCKKEYTYDFLLPKFITWYFNKRKTLESERKLYTAIVCYPLFILGVLPFGIIIFVFYALPISIIFVIITELKVLITWINNKEIKQQNDIPFLNYYLILDVPTTAAKDTIKNKTLNWYIENKKDVNNNNRAQVYEAYKVLTSNYLRPMYDAELESYTKAETYENYIFKNKLLQYHIETIRKEVHTPSTNFARTINKMLISLIIFLFILILFFLPKKEATKSKTRIIDPEVKQIIEEEKEELREFYE